MKATICLPLLLFTLHCGFATYILSCNF